MSAPERIYLQWFEDESDKYMPEGVTWCQDKIEDDDVEYVRADKIETILGLYTAVVDHRAMYEGTSDEFNMSEQTITAAIRKIEKMLRESAG